MDVLLIAMVVYLLAGLAALACSKSPRLATIAGAGGATLASLIGLAPVLRVLASGIAESLALTWDPAHGACTVEIDGLGAFFLVPVLVLAALAAIYGSSYLYALRERKSLGAPWFFFNLFVAGMVLVLTARTVVLFLMAWEIMSLAAYFLVTLEHENAETRYAGWVYLIATHLGAAFLLMAFLLLGCHVDSLDFDKFRNLTTLGAGWSGLIFVLAVVGFGAKAGFVPFHVWLPEAHSAAPSHVSALMSGVMLKMGLYGLLRVLTFLGPPELWWGPALAILGLLTALVGIALALQQRDIKRLLAYSSIENMGLIGMALGVALTASARAQLGVAALALTAAFLHVWNHALMKGLMFFAAGSIAHGTGTRDMERLGGLMRRMPWTGAAMLAGAVALAALPPMNGFTSKWLMYLSLMRDGFASNGGHALTALLAVGILALIGGLAAITFVRLIGIVLLGAPRSEDADHAHESPRAMLVPMLVLVVLCVVAAMMPALAAQQFAGVVDQVHRWEPGQAQLELDQTDAPLSTVGAVNAWTLLALAGAAGLAAVWLRRAPSAQGPTWGCGYARPSERMQYTGRSFAEMIAEHLLPRFLRPTSKRKPPQGLFPNKSEFAAESADPVSAGVYVPFFRRWASYLGGLRVFQQGNLHIYLIYVLVTVVVALGWLSLRPWVRQWWSAVG